MKRLSQYNNALCEACGEPAADGLVDKGLWCKRHGRIRAVVAFERAAFDLLRTFGWKDFETAAELVRRHRTDCPDDLYSTQLALNDTRPQDANPSSRLCCGEGGG